MEIDSQCTLLIINHLGRKQIFLMILRSKVKVKIIMDILDLLTMTTMAIV